MAYFKFVKAIFDGKPINVYNFGKMKRDFTYIDDVIEGLMRVMYKLPHVNPHKSANISDTSISIAPYKLYNIGNNSPVELMTFIGVIEQALGKTVQKKLLPMQPGDVPYTYADIEDLIEDVGFKPTTTISDGIHRFVEWDQVYYNK